MRHDCAAPATLVPFNPLVNQTKQGIASFLQNNENYTTFLSFVTSDPTYSKLLAGDWTKVSAQSWSHPSLIRVACPCAVTARWAHYLG